MTTEDPTRPDIPPAPWTLHQMPGWPWPYEIKDAHGQTVMQRGLETYSTKDTRESANARPENASTHAFVRYMAHAWRLQPLAQLSTQMAASLTDLAEWLEAVPGGLGPKAAESVARARELVAREKALKQ